MTVFGVFRPLPSFSQNAPSSLPSPLVGACGRLYCWSLCSSSRLCCSCKERFGVDWAPLKDTKFAKLSLAGVELLLRAGALLKDFGGPKGA